MDSDILLAAVLGRAAHDVRNKASALVGARDLLQSAIGANQSVDQRVTTANEILGDGESEMLELADSWGAACRQLYSATLTTIEASVLAKELGTALNIPTRLDASGTLAVRVDQRVLHLVLTRVTSRVAIGEIVVRREDGFGLSWLVIEAIGAESGEVGRTVVEEALLKMLDAHPLKKADAWVYGFRMRID